MTISLSKEGADPTATSDTVTDVTAFPVAPEVTLEQFHQHAATSGTSGGSSGSGEFFSALGDIIGGIFSIFDFLGN